MKVSDLKIVVTGAASGMGRHFALRLAELGASVAACDIAAEGLASLESEAKGYAGKIQGFTADVSKEDSVAKLMDDAWKAFGKLNGLVNNAGLFRDGLLVKKDKDTGAVKKMTLDQWQKVIDVDLTGPFLCTREFAARVVE
ncbi:MAG: SDR family NAD(P)-dependent oxidoreductase, partial [Deltaproteobacteria bacterium]|nr:SDR family NAD(P)-dependent oxidoreductase [Deltaproteobacteria bacterium]